MSKAKKILRKKIQDITEEINEQEEVKEIKKKKDLEEQVEETRFEEPEIAKDIRKFHQEIQPQQLEEIAAPIIVPTKKANEQEDPYKTTPGESYGGPETTYGHEKEDEHYEPQSDWLEKEEFNKKKSPFR